MCKRGRPVAKVVQQCAYNRTAVIQQGEEGRVGVILGFLGVCTDGSAQTHEGDCVFQIKCVVSPRSRWGEIRDFACDVLRHALAMEGGSEDDEDGGGWRHRNDGLSLDGAVQQREVLKSCGLAATRRPLPSRLKDKPSSASRLTAVHQTASNYTLFILQCSMESNNKESPEVQHLIMRHPIPQTRAEIRS